MAHAHLVYDPDKRFTIDTATKVVTVPKNDMPVLSQYDHNSEYITFEADRHVEGHDLALCDKVEVHYNNVKYDEVTKRLLYSCKGVYEVDDLQVSPENADKVILTWRVSENATRSDGELHFVVSFVCYEDGGVQYRWNTITNTELRISPGINNGEAIEAKYADVLAQWKEDLFTLSGEEATNILVMAEAKKAELEQYSSEKIGEWLDENSDIPVANWLDSHPEATTTVQDESLTTDKLVLGTLGYITPQMLGAVGDGVTDDTSAITSTFETAASLGKVVLIPQGTYLVSEVSLSNIDDLTVLCSGLIKLTEGCSLNSVTFDNCSNLNITGLRIEANYNYVRALNFVNCTNILIRDVGISNVGNDIEDQQITSADTVGIVLSGCANVDVDNVSIHYIHSLTSASGIKIAHDTNASDNIIINHADIRDVSPYSDGDGIKFVDADTTSCNLIIQNSYFEDCKKRGLKFQCQGAKSINNTFVYNTCYTAHAVIDFQRGYGESIGDTVIYNWDGNTDADANTVNGFAYVSIAIAEGYVTIRDFTQTINSDKTWMESASSTSSSFIRLEKQPLSNDTYTSSDLGSVYCENIRLDGVGHPIMLAESVTAKVVIKNIEVHLFGTSFITGPGTLVNFVLEKFKPTFSMDMTTFVTGGASISSGRIELIDIPASSLKNVDRSDKVDMIVRDETTLSANFTTNLGKRVYEKGTGNPQGYIYSSGVYYKNSKIGDICYLTTPVVEDSTVTYGFICYEAPSTDYVSGKWSPLIATIS